jgi:hypothetical protein
MLKSLFTACVIVFVTFFILGFSAELRAASPQDLDEPFSLDSEEDDTPGMLRYKAALRLFAGVGAVRNFCDVCNNEKVWAQYERRNGNTIRYVVGQFKKGLGFGQDQKLAVDAYSDALTDAVLRAANCEMIMREINSQRWDIYKGERFQEDYVLVRSKK